MTSIYVFVILGMILLGGAYILYLRDKFQKAVIGHQYSTFQTYTNSRVDALCRVEGKIVVPPSGLLSDNPKPTDYIVPDKTFNFSYPPHYPSFIQATVPSAVYNEGNPDALGQSNESPQMSAKLLHSMRNEDTAALMMREMRQFLQMDEIMAALKSASGAKTAIYISLGVLALVGVALYMNIHLSTQVGQLLALYGL